MTVIRSAFKCGGNYIPEQGERELPTVLDFTGAVSVNDDLSNEQRQGQIEFIQSVFIDNASAANNLTIQFQGGPNQRIIMPAKCQGYLPVLTTGAVRFVATSNAGLIIPLIWSNVKRGPIIWNCA